MAATMGVVMRIAVLGSGTVGQTIGSRLVELGHEVVMGARDPDNPRAAAWAAAHNGSAGTFADAAARGEIVVNATAGTASLAALEAAGRENLAGKVLVDIANPLDFSSGFPPSLSVVDNDSLAEQIQRAHPDARVVKTLNTVNADVMVHPERVPGSHDVFVAGDDEAAKQTVRELLRSMGWPENSIVDLGGIEAARGLEMYLRLWLSLMGALGSPHFNIRIVRADLGERGRTG
jgi:predicted dinucleotide-binding enzyme